MSDEPVSKRARSETSEAASEVAGTSAESSNVASTEKVVDAEQQRKDRQIKKEEERKRMQYVININNINNSMVFGIAIGRGRRLEFSVKINIKFV